MRVEENTGLGYLSSWSRERFRDALEPIICVNEICFDDYVLVSVHAPKDTSFKLFMRSFVFWVTFEKYNKPPSGEALSRISKFYKKNHVSKYAPLKSNNGPHMADFLLKRDNLKHFIDYCYRQRHEFDDNCFFKNQRFEIDGEETNVYKQIVGESADSQKLLESLAEKKDSNSVRNILKILENNDVQKFFSAKFTLYPMVHNLPPLSVCLVNVLLINKLKWPLFQLQALQGYANGGHFIFDGIVEGHRLSYHYELAHYLSDLHYRYPILLQTLTGETVDVFAHLDEWFPKR